MPLNKDILGLALYSRRKAFDDKNIDELITEYGSLESVRLAMSKADAEEIINHIKANALVIPGLTLLAPSGGGNVTGTATIT